MYGIRENKLLHDSYKIVLTVTTKDNKLGVTQQSTGTGKIRNYEQYINIKQ